MSSKPAHAPALSPLPAIAALLAATACATEAPDDAVSGDTWRQGNAAPERGRVVLCHEAGGERHTLVVPAAAISVHLAHDDVLGACPAGCVSAEGCADGDACTTDACLPGGTCSHVAVDCDDGDPCTIESCSPAAGCGSTPADGVPCDDGNECTDDDACAAGSCQGATVPGCCADDGDCEDADGCTVDACVAGACANTPLGCTVGDACVVGFCDPATGECDATQVSCDDGDPCTNDGCDPTSGCVHAPMGDWTCGSITRVPGSHLPWTESAPAISGTRVVWAELAGGPGRTDVRLHDFATDTTHNLTETLEEAESSVDIDGQHVVWQQRSWDGTTEIVHHFLGSGQRDIVATSNETSSVRSPSTSSGVVSWTRMFGDGQTDLEICTWTMTRGFTVLPGVPGGGVTNMRATPGSDSMMMVYEGPVPGQPSRTGIVAFDLARAPTAVPAPVAASAMQVMPDGEGYTVVYVENGENGDRLLAYHLQDQTTRELSNAISTKLFPRISGTRVVWADDRNGDFDVYGYDLASGTESAIVQGPGDQDLPAIDGNRIAYVDHGAETWGLYLYEFTG